MTTLYGQLSTYCKYSLVNQGREYWYIGSTSARSAITKYKRDALRKKVMNINKIRKSETKRKEKYRGF